MKNLKFKVLFFIILSYVIFLSLLYILYGESQIDFTFTLPRFIDIFFFLWLFVVPLLVYILILGIPLYFMFKNNEKGINPFRLFLVIIGLFFVDSIFTSFIYGIEVIHFKIAINAILFVTVFGNYIRMNTKSPLV